MSELSARLNVYGAIDAAVRDDPSRLEAVAAVVPAYGLDLGPAIQQERVRPTTGWFDDFTKLVGNFERTDLDTALLDLSNRRGTDELTELHQAHRLRAVWALTRALPEIGETANLIDTLVPVVTPMVPPETKESTKIQSASFAQVSVEPPTEEHRERARRAINHLQDRDRFPDATSWPDMIDELERQQLLSTSVAALAKLECHDKVVFAPVTQADGTVELEPAARIVTRVSGFAIGATTLAQVKTKLTPPNWPGCMKTFWCDMKATDPTGPTPPTGVLWFQESVGECPNIWFDPHLRFFTRDLAPPGGPVNGFELQYDLCDADALRVLDDHATKMKLPPPAQDRRVEVDLGVIRAVVDVGAGPGGQNLLSIWTSKVIRLREPLPTGGVAILACTSGWADQTRLMITGCLATP